MSIKDGKRKNWGSRSGKSKKLKADDSATTILAHHALTTDLLSLIARGEPSLQEAAKCLLETRTTKNSKPSNLEKVFSTKLGQLYRGDCLTLLSKVEDDSIDCIFADPPFNLRKNYENGQEDEMPDHEYLEWSYTWLEACAKKLKSGGSFFVYNIPKWGTYYASFLNNYLSFKNWIAVDITFSLPIPNRLYPSHYSLLYFVKDGKPNTFTPPRVPIKTCVRCGQEQNDYGGYKMKMNPEGINIRDVWTDIPPVRHAKYKNRDANELSLKLLDRILDISTKPGDLIFDPFGGSGTSYIAAELKNRKWLGVELGDCSPIIERFKFIEDDRSYMEKIRKDINTLFTDKALQLRAKSGLPLDNYQISDDQIKRALGSFQKSMDL